MKQTERIQMMEQHLDRAQQAINQLEKALQDYLPVRESIMTVSQYFGNDDWNQDHDDDKAGLLPQDLKRGVLSEDGIWNLLQDNRDLMIRLFEMVTDEVKNQFYI